jgi:hypothetical protein
LESRVQCPVDWQALETLRKGSNALSYDRLETQALDT